MSRRLASGVACALVIAGLVLTSIAPALAVGGQTGNVNGRVLDDAGKPVAGATIRFVAPQGSYTAKTDGNGYFNLLGVIADTYAISIDITGFSAFTQSGINVPGGDTTQLGTVRLQHALKTIGAVTARSVSSAFTPNQTVPQFTVGGQQLVAAQGKTSNPDLSSALLAVPGFQQDSSGNLILQGSQTTQIRYQVDGIDITQPASEGSISQNFLNGVRSLQVVPGAGDPSQGNAGAGVVNLLMKRGTNPSFGTLDFEAGTRPFDHQFNIEYGAATKDGRLSDYVSFLGRRFDESYGNFGSTGFANNAVYGKDLAGGALNRVQNDFVNNFVYKFGPSFNQSLQVLYQNHYDQEGGNYAGLKLYYPSNAPDLLAAMQSVTKSKLAPNGLTYAQIQSVLGFESTQTSTTQQINNASVWNINSNVVKLEYDNAFNSTTNLALRYFHTTNYEYDYPDGPTPQSIAAVNDTAEAIGGSRDGGNFELDKQLGRKNLITLSGSYDFDRPIFSFLSPLQGIESIGPNAVDFLRPANPNAPISSTNPCPITGGCYLQQFFYKQGGSPRVPPMDLSSQQLINRYGAGFRDQFQVNSRLRLDVGVHYDRMDQGYGSTLFAQNENVQPVPGSPTTYYIPNWDFIEQPHYLEPRYGGSFLLSKSDTVSVSYGRSIISNGTGSSPNSHAATQIFNGIPLNPNFVPSSDPYTGAEGPVGNSNCFQYVPYPTGATATSKPSYNGVVGSTLQLGRPCKDYADLLYGVNDAFFPEIVTVHPSVFDNVDLSFGHQFKNGSALKIAPYVRQGYGVEAATAPLIFNPATGVYQYGSIVDYSVGRNTTTGADIQYTLPERRYGLNGFVSVSYVNEFSTTPPAGDNPYAQDNGPVVLPASLALNGLYRAGYVSPLTTRIGVNYRTRKGFRINPVLNLNVGYPYGSGLLTPQLINGLPTNVINTNITDQYGAGGAAQYVDPANPGSVFNPNIAATRGTKESSSGGGQLSRPQLTGNLTIEYTAPGSRATIGAQILNIFNNQQYGNPLVNNNFYPVVTGIGGPLTGLNQQAASYPGYYSPINSAWNPYAPYYIPTVPTYGAIGTPTTFRLYAQYAL